MYVELRLNDTIFKYHPDCYEQIIKCLVPILILSIHINLQLMNEMSIFKKLYYPT